MRLMCEAGGQASGGGPRWRCRKVQTSKAARSACTLKADAKVGAKATSSRYGAGVLYLLGRRVCVVCTDDDQELTADGCPCHGIYYPGNLLIVLDSRAPLGLRAATLAHEIGHAVIDLVGMGGRFTEQLEEDILEVFLPAYLDALGAAASTNDSLMKFLGDAEPKKRGRKRT